VQGAIRHSTEYFEVTNPTIKRMANVHLTYLILAHHKPDQVAGLIDSLDDDNTSFCVHFDAKSAIKGLLRNKFASRKNVKVLQSDIDVNWGGYNMVAATLKLMKAGISQKRGYLILLSGQDLAIKSNDHIRHFYEHSYGNQYMDYSPLPSSSWALHGGLDRINYYWFVDQVGKEASFMLYEGQIRSGFKRPFFSGLVPYGGSQWWSLTMDCAEYILNFVRANRSFDDFMRYCLIPDELYFQNILLNSPLQSSVINDNLRYIDWQSGPESPRILRSEDFPKMMTSDCLFARKFDTAIDSTIYSLIRNETAPKGMLYAKDT